MTTKKMTLPFWPTLSQGTFCYNGITSDDPSDRFREGNARSFGYNNASLVVQVSYLLSGTDENPHSITAPDQGHVDILALQ